MQRGFTLIKGARLEQVQWRSSFERVKGFTLIELLVVVVLIVILSTIGLAVFNQTLSKTRDNQRKSDLRNIVTALELYYQKNNRYPCANVWQLSSAADPWIRDGCISPAAPLDTNYIEKVPKDPKSDSGNPVTSLTNITGYAYRTPTSVNCPGSSGKYYILAAGLENSNDPEADGNRNYQYCNGDLITITGSNAYVLIPQ